MMETNGSGCSAMGMASFSNSAALRLAGPEGGGAGGKPGEVGLASGTAPRISMIENVENASRRKITGFTRPKRFSNLRRIDFARAHSSLEPAPGIEAHKCKSAEGFIIWFRGSQRSLVCHDRITDCRELQQVGKLIVLTVGGEFL